MFILLSAGILLSCEREELDIAVTEQQKEAPPPVDAMEYLQLRPGNYWVYESYSYDRESGEEAPLYKKDSLFVRKDTLVKGQRYFILAGTRLGQPYRELLRTAGTELWNAAGQLMFSTARAGQSTALADSLLPAGAISGQSLLQEAETLEVPYGIFDAGVLEHRLSFEVETNAEGKASQEVRYQSDFYVQGIGLVQYTDFLLHSSTDIRMKLLRCRVQ